MSDSSSKDPELLQRLLELSAREKKSIAYDMHDGFVQLMVGALMNLDTVAKRNENPTAEKRKKNDQSLKEAQSNLRQAVEEARKLIGDLRATELDPAELGWELQRLCQQVECSSIQLQCLMQISPAGTPFENGTLYRLLQELLNNVQRHSQAESAAVLVQSDSSAVHFLVADNGIGMDVPANYRSTFGIRGIQDRCRWLGGEVRWISNSIEVGEDEWLSQLLVACANFQSRFTSSNERARLSELTQRVQSSPTWRTGTLVQIDIPRG